MNFKPTVAGLCLLIATLLPAPRAAAFSLLGPYADWMTSALGYRLPYANEIGGPMNLGEEYRWNIPVITYGFDPAFQSWFGEPGIAEVEKAVAILNVLPPASELDPSLFPTNAKGPLNHQAVSQSLFDLKSASLASLLQLVGLTGAERFMWTLRNTNTDTNGNTTYTVIQRNFDPIRFVPTNVVNATAYTYTVFDPIDANSRAHADAVERPIDPAADDFTSAAGGLLSDPTRGANLRVGEYFTNITRDDAGGIRYLLRRDNLNAESLPPGVTAAKADEPFPSTAIRPGVEKMLFQRIPFNTDILGLPPVTNHFELSYLSNGVIRTQSAQRISRRPDILFSAANVRGENGYPDFVKIMPGGFRNESTLNAADSASGPGIMLPGATVVFGKTTGGRFVLSPSFPHGFSLARWGTIENETNVATVYPAPGTVQPNR